MTDMNQEPLLRRSDLMLSAPYQKPEGGIGQAVADVWQRVLNVDLVGMQDDFFEIGGDSLMASALSAGLESRFDCRFSPGNIVEASTVATQIAFIERQLEKQKDVAGATPSNLTVCNERGRKAPLFILHGAIGFTLYDKRFLEGFDKERPVVFIEAIGLDGKETPLEHIESIAERYLAAVRQIAPAGNWLLAANCAGGLIALEMCQQADRSGDKVSRLLLVDPMPQIFRTAFQTYIRWLRKRLPRIFIKTAFQEYIWRSKKRWLAHIPRQVRSFAGRSSDQDDNEQVAYEEFLEKRRKKQSRMEDKIRQRAGEVPNSMVSSQVAYSAEAMRGVSQGLEKAFKRYASSRWNGPTFVLASDDRSRHMGTLRSYFPCAKFRLTSYDHRSLFTQGLLDIPKFFNDSLDPDAENSFLS